MEPLTRLQTAIDQAAAVMDNVQRDDYSRPTPCPEWTARDLMNHMVGALVMFRDVAANGSVDPSILEADHLGDDAAAALRDVGGAAVQGWSAPGKMDGMANLPFGEFPASFALGLPAMDMLVHAWDLAQATGQSVDWHSGLVGDVREFTGAMLADPQMRGDDFGPAVPAGPNDDEMTQLVRFLGRAG